MLKNIHIISFSFKQFHLSELGNLVPSKELLPHLLMRIKNHLDLSELFFLNTCNRVELIFIRNTPLHEQDYIFILKTLTHDVSDNTLNLYNSRKSIYHREDAVRYFFRVISSLESMVTGEREIASQIKNALEFCKNENLCGSVIQTLIEKGLKTHKEVFSKTAIADNPVSVLSLASRKIFEMVNDHNANVLFVGAGQANRIIGKYMIKKGFKNFIIINRTKQNGELFAKQFNAIFYPLEDLSKIPETIDILITATSSSSILISKELIKKWTNNFNRKLITIDLSVPCNIDPAIQSEKNIDYINIDCLEKFANENKKLRQLESENACKIIDQNIISFVRFCRKKEIENAFKDLPEEMKNVKIRTFSEIYHDKINQLDRDTKVLLDEIVEYMEKKYISIPMKIAKEILV